MADWITVKDDNQSSDRTHDFETDKVIEGIYFNNKENVGRNLQTIYQFEIGEELVDVWGATILDRKMQGIEVGEEVKITYLGKKISKTSKREFKDYDVKHRKIEPTTDIDTSNLPF